MKVGTVTALIAAIGAFGIFETLQAAPKESQRLRGMEGRVFFVDSWIVDPDGNILAPNAEDYCYFFNSNAEWIDQQFPGQGEPPVPGTWEQDSVGAATSYTATASAFEGILEIFQEGHVTPARGRGVLQLESLTDVFLFGNFLLTVLTVGSEVDECPLPAGD